MTVVRGRCVTFGDRSVWKTPRAERGKHGMESRIITTEARRTPREESPNPQRLSVEKNRRCLTGASGRRHERSVGNPGITSRGMRDPTSKLCLEGNTKQIPLTSSILHHQSSILNLPSFHFISYICDNIIIISSLC